MPILMLVLWVVVLGGLGAVAVVAYRKLSPYLTDASGGKSSGKSARSVVDQASKAGKSGRKSGGGSTVHTITETKTTDVNAADIAGRTIGAIFTLGGSEFAYAAADAIKDGKKKGGGK